MDAALLKGSWVELVIGKGIIGVVGGVGNCWTEKGVFFKINVL